MRIGRRILIPAVLLLGVAASALVGAELSASAAHVPSSHVQITAASAGSDTMYRG